MFSDFYPKLSSAYGTNYSILSVTKAVASQSTVPSFI